MSKKQSPCPHCGASMRINRYELNSTLVKALNLIYMNREKYKNPRDFLSKSQYANYTKLKYWGLLSKQNGIWEVTQKGIDFLNGKISQKMFVSYFRDKVVEFYGPEITSKEINNKIASRIQFSMDRKLAELSK